jgi:DNA-binding XRE family transcriptional regulator
MDFFQKLDGEILQEVGEGVRSWRKQRGLSQTQLAQNIGVGRSTIVNIEDGKGINLSHFIKILKHFGKEDKFLELFQVVDISPKKQFFNSKRRSS